MGRQGLMDDAGYHGFDYADICAPETELYQMGQQNAYEECADIFESWVDCNKCPIENCKQYGRCRDTILKYLKGEIDG